MKDFFRTTQHPKQEKKQKQPPGWMILKGVSIITILILLGTLFYQGRNLFFSPLEQIQVHGNSTLSKETIVQYLDLKENESWLDLDPYILSLRLKQHLWIKSAVVHRNLKLGLDVYITERTPVAYLKLKTGLFLLCENNLVLKTSRINQGNWDLPVVINTRIENVSAGMVFHDVGISRALALLDKLKTNPILNASSISEINIDDPLNMELVTTPHGIRVKLGYQKLTEKINNLALAMPALKKMKRSLQYVDLRHRNGVVIKRK